MRKIFLYGHLAEQYGDMYELEVSTAGEAIRALCANFPTFVNALAEGCYEIIRGDRAKPHHLELDYINTFNLGAADLHIIPAIEGAKGSGGGAIKLIMGVALVGAAVFFSGGVLAAPLGSGLFSGVTWGNVAMLGFGLAVAGVASLLTPKQVTKGNESSFALKGPTNTTEQGQPVPLVYGEVICGSQLISSGLDIDPIPVDWVPPT